MEKTFRILGFAGSLRRDSYNKALLRAAQELVPEGVVLEIFDIGGCLPEALQLVKPKDALCETTSEPVSNATS
jgi:NAD(P)H-dependent FMN reductase